VISKDLKLSIKTGASFSLPNLLSLLLLTDEKETGAGLLFCIFFTTDYE
jgi:hypothetical protein